MREKIPGGIIYEAAQMNLADLYSKIFDKKDQLTAAGFECPWEENPLEDKTKLLESLDSNLTDYNSETDEGKIYFRISKEIINNNLYCEVEVNYTLSDKQVRVTSELVIDEEKQKISRMDDAMTEFSQITGIYFERTKYYDKKTLLEQMLE